MGLFSFLRRLDSADGTRDAMRKSYHGHLHALDQRLLPAGTTPHDAALYGALANRYKVPGANPDAMEPFIWLELIPFRWMSKELGPVALAEYVVWKESETRHEARLEWLREQLALAVQAARAKESDLVFQAYHMGPAGEYSSPWTALVPEQG